MFMIAHANQAGTTRLVFLRARFRAVHLRNYARGGELRRSFSIRRAEPPDGNIRRQRPLVICLGTEEVAQVIQSTPARNVGSAVGPCQSNGLVNVIKLSRFVERLLPVVRLVEVVGADAA